MAGVTDPAVRILHLIPTLEGGGAERQLSMLAAEQCARGHDVHVGVRRAGVYAEPVRENGGTVHVLGDHRDLSPSLLLRIHRLVRKLRPDVLQTWLPQMDILGGVAALWNEVPWILSERTGPAHYQQHSASMWFRGRLARYAAAIVANSSGGSAYWRRLQPWNGNERVLEIGNAIDIVRIREAAPGSQARADASTVMSTILVVGRLDPVKAIDVILDAVRLVSPVHAVRVLVLGDGPQREELGSRASRAGLEGRVAFIPFQKDWWGHFDAASILVSMSRYEGRPNVVLEAMAARCPVIVSDIPAHRDLLGEDTAVFVPPDDPRELAEAILAVLDDPVSARERAARAAIVVEPFTVGSVADAYESIYERAAGRWRR